MCDYRASIIGRISLLTIRIIRKSEELLTRSLFHCPERTLLPINYYLRYRPIDPASPIPEDCDPEAKKKRAKARAKGKQDAVAASNLETKESKNVHQEL